MSRIEARHSLRRGMFGVRLALLGVVALVVPAKAQAPVPADAPYLNPSLPVEQRVKDLISRMTLEEKASQMRDDAPGIPRLRLPKYDWWNEAAHGVAAAGYATNFPTTVGMAATWDAALIYRIGDVVSTEGRAKHHQAVREGRKDSWFYGLTFWAPNINIFRDPRWGRGQETYGEDPFLAGTLATQFVRGMQGDDPKYLKVVSTPKHYAVHSGPESVRHQFNVDVTPHDLEDTYLPAFRLTVTQGHAQSVMCAYNRVDGVPACASERLLREHLRKAWGFDGYVVSDCGAIRDITTGHKYAPDFLHAGVVALKAGTDLECRGQPYQELPQAVKQGLVTEAQMDTALVRLFTARFRLGMFDPPESFAYGRIQPSAINSPAHRALALQAAREAIVLLKNDGVLPLAGKKKIAVVGPTAIMVASLQGNYNGTPPDPVYPLIGIEKRFGAANVVYATGSVLADGLAVPVQPSALRTGSQPGLKGEYFNNLDLSGKPVAVRVDRFIDFNWDKGSPLAGLTKYNYSVRWTGTFTAPAPGDYRLGARVNNCYGCRIHEIFRLYVDDKLLVENTNVPNDAGVLGLSPVAPIHFADTKPHAIRLEYVHRDQPGGVDLTWVPPADVARERAVAAAKQADVVVAFVGLSPDLEGEEMPVKLEGFSGGDRTDIALPKPQRELIAALKTTGKPVVLVSMSGSALALDDGMADAILQAWYPGEEGGTAIAETLAGDNNPAGRLPVTFYASVEQLPPFEEYSMANRTYRYFTGKPWRGFGFGLSYSKFAYSSLKLPASVTAGDSVVVEADVKNLSTRAGDEVVELYLTQPKQALTPIRTLAAFARVNVKAGQSVHVALPVSARTIGQVDEKGARVIVPGTYEVFVGGTQPGESEGGVSGTFTVTGPSKELPR